MVVHKGCSIPPRGVQRKVPTVDIGCTHSSSCTDSFYSSSSSPLNREKKQTHVVFCHGSKVVPPTFSLHFSSLMMLPWPDMVDPVFLSLLHPLLCSYTWGKVAFTSTLDGRHCCSSCLHHRRCQAVSCRPHGPHGWWHGRACCHPGCRRGYPGCPGRHPAQPS